MFLNDIHLDGGHHHIKAALFRLAKHLVIHGDLVQAKGNLLLDFVANDLAYLIFRDRRQSTAACKYRLAGHAKNDFLGSQLRLFEHFAKRHRTQVIALCTFQRRVAIVFPLNVFGDHITGLCLGQFAQAHRACAYVQNKSFLLTGPKTGHNHTFTHYHGQHFDRHLS